MSAIVKLNRNEIDNLSNTFEKYIASKTSSALSKLFSEPIEHKIRILDNGISDIKKIKLENDEIRMCGVKLNGKGDTHIEICYTIKLKHAKKIASKLLGQEVSELDTLGNSALQEVANILTGSFFNAVSDGTGFRVELSTPDLAHGELTPLVSVVAKDVINPVEYAVIADAELMGTTSGIKIHMIIIQDPENARKLLDNNGKNTKNAHQIGSINSELEELIEDSFEDDLPK
jgi:chemotaxis protein CheC